MKRQKTVVIIVAHPDDEILWAGGTIINHPEWQCFVVCLCRKNDPDRAPRFYSLLNLINARGIMGDLDDSPEQKPLEPQETKKVITSLMPSNHFDIVISHNPAGEYTRHRRHEEIGKAVIELWHNRQIDATEFWMFAYEDGGGKYIPRAIQTADLFFPLSHDIWQQKYEMIHTIYNFPKDGWESRTTPVNEAFWRFTNSHDAMNRLMAEQKL